MEGRRSTGFYFALPGWLLIYFLKRLQAFIFQKQSVLRGLYGTGFIVEAWGWVWYCGRGGVYGGWGRKVIGINIFGGNDKRYYICNTIVIMNENNKRTDFSKSGTKGENKSIRFNNIYLEYVKEKEKLDTHQKCVDFLMQKYWFEGHFGNNPINERLKNIDMKIGAEDKEEKNAAPNPKDKAAYLKWLKEN